MKLIIFIAILFTSIVSAQVVDTSKILVKFNEPMSSVGLKTISNYKIVDDLNREIPIYKIGTEVGDTLMMNIYLYTQKINDLYRYKITVINVTDKAGNVIAPDNQPLTVENKNLSIQVVPPKVK